MQSEVNRTMNIVPALVGAQKPADLRKMYEPYVCSLSEYFHVSIPPWSHPATHPDNWHVSAWEPPSGLSRKRETGAMNKMRKIRKELKSKHIERII